MKLSHPIYLILLSALLLGCSQRDAVVLPVSLTCEYLEDPLNIDIAAPGLSWQLEPVSADMKNLKQTAYQIICASSLEKLNANNGDIWKTGKMNSSSSQQIKYEGRELKSFENCYWKVRIWDQDGKRSEWSKPAQWKMAVMDASLWNKATWIGFEEDTRRSGLKNRIRDRERFGRDTVESHPSPLLRKEFEINAELQSAFIYISGLGYNEVFINGGKAGNHVLDPGQTSYDVNILYSTYDITALMRPDSNAVAVMLGNGFFGQNMAFSESLEYGKPRMKAMIRLLFEDQSEQIIYSDTSWKCTTGPVIFDNVYAGETYDARKELTGWKLPGYNDSNWQKAIHMEAPGGELTSQLMPPIRKTGELRVKEIIQNNRNTWTLDFGQNISGWARITLNEKKGTKITLNYAEALFIGTSTINLASLGGFATGFGQEDIYICKGEGTEIWEPKFTYHGFRYIEISGLTSPPDEETVRAVLVHSDVQPVGDFECSSPVLNKMYEISKWTVVDNLHSIPEDCPHREKCGWLGDAHAVAEFSIFNYNMAGFYTKFMKDIDDVLGRGKAGVDNKTAAPRVPTMVAPGKRLAGEAALDWGVSIIFLPYYLYLYYGDESVFENHYNEMKIFIDHMLSFKNEKGIIENGLGDWCPPRWDRQTNPEAMECHPHVSANAFFYKALNIMSLMAHKLNDIPYAEWSQEKADQLKTAFNNQFLVSVADDKFWYESQTATIMALDFGLVPDSAKQKVIEGLVYDIVENHDKHHTTGIHGHRPYYSVLTNLGLDQLAYDVLTNPTFPSQAYIVNAGLTTWPERQWEWASGIEWDRSLNHPMQAGFAAFFHENVLGIKPDSLMPGFRNIIMKPHFIHQLEWAKGHHSSPFGKISSSWRKHEDTFYWEISIPPGCTAKIHLPAKDMTVIKENGTALYRHTDAGSVVKNGNYFIVDVGSGNYKFETVLQ